MKVSVIIITFYYYICYIITTPPSSYITLYKTIFIHLYLCISMRITLTVNRHGNRKTGWPNRIQQPSNSESVTWKGIFFFLSWPKTWFSFLFFFDPAFGTAREIITTPLPLPSTYISSYPSPTELWKYFPSMWSSSCQLRTQKNFPLILNFFSYLYLKAHQMTTVRTISLRRRPLSTLSPCWNWRKLYFVKTKFRSQRGPKFTSNVKKEATQVLFTIWQFTSLICR